MAGLALLWLFVMNASCVTTKRQDELIDKLWLARFCLEECQDMGAGHFDPESLETAMRLRDEIEDMVARRAWSQARKGIETLQETVALLQEGMKSWDPDADGLSNYAEFMLYGTSWNNPDSDGDGYLDGSEIFIYRTDPLDHCGVPVDEPLETQAERSCPALEGLMEDGSPLERNRSKEVTPN